MKIAVDGIIFEKQALGGISRIYHETLPRMCQQDDSLWITLLTSGPLMQEIPQHTNIQHQSLPNLEGFLRPGRFFVNTRSRLRAKVQSSWMLKNPSDIWHSTYYTLPYNWRGSVITTLYDLIYERFPEQFSSKIDRWRRYQIRQAVNTADAVICISETTRQDAVRFYGADPMKLHVIPLAASSIFQKVDADTSHRPFLLFIGMRAGYKGFETLLEAYSRWSYKQQIDLLVVGSQWTKEEQKKLRDLNISDCVNLRIAVTDEELVALYNQATALVHPSLYEGFGLPLLEAMACGCPIVASNIPSSFEVAGDAAYFFTPDNTDDLKNVLDRVVNNGREAQKVQLGYRLASSYSWDAAARKTLELYRAHI